MNLYLYYTYKSYYLNQLLFILEENKKLHKGINFQARFLSSKKGVEQINPRIYNIIEDISTTKNFIIALTHKSLLKKDKTLQSYERLEYLGDSLLNLYVSIFLYYSFPEYSEGKLTEIRSTLVRGTYLSSLNLKIGLYKFLKSEKYKNIDLSNLSSSKKQNKVLNDIFESFIAALFIERGGKALFEFLSLTVFNKPEFKSKLDYFNNNIVPILFSELSKTELNNTIKIKENSIKEGIISDTEKPDGLIKISDNLLRNKLYDYLVRSTIIQDKNIELLTKNNDTMIKLINHFELMDTLVRLRDNDYSIKN